MDGGSTAAAAALSFLPLAAGRGGVRLHCLRQFEPPSPAAPDGAAAILAHCRGVEAGRRPLPAAVEAGAEIEVPIARLPRLALPAELRFSLSAEGPDLAPPWPLPNAATALALLGAPTALEVEEMRLEQGILRHRPGPGERPAGAGDVRPHQRQWRAAWPWRRPPLCRRAAAPSASPWPSAR